jgi:thiol-disulfide isomerase/thioredoxin
MLIHFGWKKAAWLLLAAGALVWTGCGGHSRPVTSETSKFKPASAAKTGDDRASEQGETAGAPEVGPSVPGRDESIPASPFAGQAKPAGDKPPEPGPDGNYPVPEGDTKALLKFIDDLARREPRGRTRQEQLEDLVAMQEARLEAGKRALAGGLDERTRTALLNAMQEIHILFLRIGLPDANDRLNNFAAELAASKDPAVAEAGRLRQFEVRIMDILRRQPKEADEIVMEIKQLVEAEKSSAAAFEAATQICGVLEQIAQEQPDMRPGLIEALLFVGNAYKGNADAKVAERAKGHLSLVKRIQLDLPGKLNAVLEDKPNADEEFLTALKGVLAESEPNSQLLSDLLMRIGYPLEGESRRQALAIQVFDTVAEAFKDAPDEELAKSAVTMAANAHKRVELIGKPLEISGVKLDGSPLDWKSYQGKVVLVDFWATWCGPCIEELPNIKRNFRLYRDQGFDVIGVSLDSEVAAVEQFLALQDIPWTIVVSQELADKRKVDNGFEANPLAQQCGIDAIPFVVLIGKDGNVDSIHVRGEKLAKRLQELLGEPAALKRSRENSDQPPAEKPAAEDTEKPAGKRRASAKPAEEKPAEPAQPPASADEGSCGGDEPQTQAAPAPAESQTNPYSAKPGLSTADLAKYIERMLDKPKSIQARPGFAEALCEACDRVLAADPPAKEADWLLAAETKFETLHKAACNGDAKADAQLAAFCEQMKNDTRPRVASQVAFFALERKALEGDKLPPEQIEPLLNELRDYFAKERLLARHLRLASSTVALINRLEDGDARERHFETFGNLFARSSDKELARYGKKLAKKPAAAESELVGREMELAGTTASGAAFDWKKYRGNVVLVDFWATWCGPCRREMPHVRELYDRLHDQGLKVVAVSLDEDAAALTQYLEENQIPWETLAGEGTKDLAEKYGVRGIPTMMVVDKEGKIVGVAHQLAPLRPVIEKALK